MARNGSRPPKEVQLARINAEKSQNFWDGVFSTVRTGIRWTGIVLCLFCVYLTAEALAGSRTEVIMGVLAQMSADRYVAYLVAALCSVGYVRQRRTNKRLAKSTGDYLKELEKRLDPGRSSSRLDDEGMPSKEELDGA